MIMSAKSIITDDITVCYICGRPAEGAHHCVYGNANRKLSEKYGLTVGLCYNHHRGNEGVHFNRELDMELKQMAQRRFTETYPDKDFMSIFGKNYL